MMLKNKLSRLKPHLSSPVQERRNPAPETKFGELPFQERWKRENVHPYFLDQQYCFIRETVYPLSHKHGIYQLNEFINAVDLWNDNSVQHPLSAAGHNPEELFFFDTETTGLGGGVGNTIFLLGYASIKEDHLVLRQHFLPNPGGEVALYYSFLENVNYKTLVTYNGKSFDWPQVKTRHTLVRDHVPKLPQFGHFDLYHAARRLWKHKLERLKLTVVEEEILGFQRKDDIPGYLAPMIYFDFVESGQPDGMLGILKHNENDILSLITLYTHLTYQLNGKSGARTRLESYEVGRWYAALGEQNRAEKLFTSLVNGTDAASEHARLSLGYQYKKAKQWDLALCFFQEVADNGSLDRAIEACIETAKLLEHKQKNIDLAIHYCEKALKAVKHTDMKRSPAFFQELEKRHTRLLCKNHSFPG